MAESNEFEAAANAAPTEGYPDWFDAAVHSVGPGGIYETATNVLLGEDGEPASAAVRAGRAAAAAALVVEAEAAPAAKKGRDTITILTEHQAKLAAADPVKE